MATLCYLVCIRTKPGTHMWGKTRYYSVLRRASYHGEKVLNNEIVHYATRKDGKRFLPRIIFNLVKLHEVKSTFLPCSIRYFSPDFS